MDFGLTEDQTAVRDLVRKVARGEIAPGTSGVPRPTPSPGKSTDS
jgi:hypothetical protein